MHFWAYLATLGLAAKKQLALCHAAMPHRAHLGLDVIAKLTDTDARSYLVTAKPGRPHKRHLARVSTLCWLEPIMFAVQLHL